MPSTLHIERADGELTYRIQIGLDGELIITKAGDDSTMVIRPHHSNQVSIL
ncbi:hypothetical protein [Hymenobacter latericus]|uniref:hypothetical protein n=1 Tax=Hymenobacter sp. YIM 151858-1 TaxID=2987688 RepID=UPI002225F46C|nr:hypothetical protein [Hymenobacter sp. YIM 151858-1]UYZ60058.1 hypothetical protein OIS50_04480 [Hymenobacter sp. YIM 151858-1]